MMTFTVHKLNTHGEVVVTYAADLAERLPTGVVLHARWVRPSLDLGYTTFEADDRFIEWFYTDRWYNVFEIHAATGALKGWYCNIAEPAVITANTIACRDLLLDLWVAPDGSMQVLDEDEFAADPALDATTRASALAALDALQQLVRAREFPFATVGHTALPDVG
jgi:predicted RNA-binding protein associated with RNAse of E/G family